MTSSVKRLTSAMPISRPSSSTTGKARKRYWMKNSQAVSTLAVAGMDATRSTMISAMGTRGPVISSRRVGTTPTSFPLPSTT